MGAAQSRPKPHQCDIKATTKRVDRQPIATLKPPQCDPKATSKLPQSPEYTRWAVIRGEASPNWHSVRSIQVTSCEPAAFASFNRVRSLLCTGYTGQSRGPGRERRLARMAAPSAPVYWGRDETHTAQDKAVSRARTMPDWRDRKSVV